MAYHENAKFIKNIITNAPHQDDINRGLYTMYVYIEIVEYQSVGDSYIRTPFKMCTYNR